jgi:decaprenylphospho-beta-D-erythro-pentofuranosid-2-ulose 2-reductase
MKRIIVLGASSAIAEATCRIWAKDGCRFILVGRSAIRLEDIARDLKIRGANEAMPIVLDCVKANAQVSLREMVGRLGGVDIVLLAYAILNEQRNIETDPAALSEIIQTNFTSAAAWAVATSKILEEQRSGTLLVLGSVAGDRPRRTNIVYGATKAGLARLVEGIAHKLAPIGARAVVIKPGFVDTPMTSAIENRGVLWSTPKAVASVIVKAERSGGPTVYAPRYWRLIMLVIRHLPVFAFNKIGF